MISSTGSAVAIFSTRLRHNTEPLSPSFNAAFVRFPCWRTRGPRNFGGIEKSLPAFVVRTVESRPTFKSRKANSLLRKISNERKRQGLVFVQGIHRSSGDLDPVSVAQPRNCRH